ncbi:MAG: hypothetical protein ACI8ZB_001019 [Desulforhopalus sp.]|jgi:hypothetical protein
MSDIFGKISIEPDNSDSRAKKKKKTNVAPRKRQTHPKAIKTSTLLWLLIPVGLLLIYALLGYRGVPYYITHVIPEQVSKNYGLNLTTGKISFNPFTFTLKSESTTLREPEGDPIVSIPNVELNFAPIQLMRMDLVCNRVNITSPSIHIVRLSDGSYNFSSLLSHLKKEDVGSGIIGFSDLPFAFSLNNISITDGAVVFDDKPTKKIHNIRELELQLPTLSNIPFQAHSYIDPHFSAIVNGSQITFRKDGSRATSQTHSSRQLSWELKDIKVEDYVNYLPFDFPFSINKGTADGTLDLAFNNQNGLEDRLTVNFDLTVADIDVETQPGNFMISSPKTLVSGSFVPVKKTLIVNTLSLDSPIFTSHSKDLLQDLSSMFFVEKKTVDQPIPITKPVSFTLHSLQFTNGRLKQIWGIDKDASVRDWTELNITMNNYVSDELDRLTDSKPSTLNISGHLENGKNDFSYIARFESPSVVSGELSIEKMTSNDLLSLILPNEKPINSKGTGTLHSFLTISKDGKNQQQLTTFSRVDATLNNVEILTKSQPIFSAEKLSFSGAIPHSSTTNLGKVTVEDGAFYYYPGKQLSVFSKIESEQYIVEELNYQGNVTINNTKANSHPFTLTDATIQYSNNDSSEKAENSVVLSAKAGKDGKVDAKGKVSFNPFKIDVSTTFTNINNSETAALLPENSFIGKTAGTLSGKGTFTFPQTAFTGHMSVLNGHFTRSDGQAISWDRFELKNVNYTSLPYHVGVGHINIDKPQLSASIKQENDSIAGHFFDLLRETLKNNGPSSPENKKISISPIDIQAISVADGQVTIDDHRLAPTWTGKITELNGGLKNIHSANSAADSTFSFTGRLDSSDFTWTGSIDPFKNTKTDKYTFELANYPLTGFSSQLEPVTDINTKSSSINLSISTEWEGGDEYQSIRSTISQLKAPSLDSESALPLALLCNKEGDLQLDFSAPLTSFTGYTSIFDDLTNNFKKLIIKGKISPLLLAKGDFTDLIDDASIDFRPGEFMLSDKGRRTLSRYGALLVAHPHIKLSLSGGAFLKIDRESLHNQLEKDESSRVKKVNEQLFIKWQEKKEEYDSQVTSNQSISEENGTISESDIPARVLSGFRPLLPEPVVVDNEMLFELTEKRLEVVKRHLTTQLSLTPERVEIRQQSVDELSRDSRSNGVQVEILPL